MKLKSPIVIPCLLTFHAISLHHRGNSERVFVFVFSFDPRGRCRAPSIPAHNDKNVSISLRYSPLRDPLWSAPRPPNIPGAGRIPRSVGHVRTRRDGKGELSKLSALFPLQPSLSLRFLSVLAARFIKIEGSSSVPLPSRKSAETFRSSFLPIFFSLSNLSRRRWRYLVFRYFHEKHSCAFFRTDLFELSNIRGLHRYSGGQRVNSSPSLYFLSFFSFWNGWERERESREAGTRFATNLAKFGAGNTGILVKERPVKKTIRIPMLGYWGRSLGRITRGGGFLSSSFFSLPPPLLPFFKAVVRSLNWTFFCTCEGVVWR